MNFKEFLHLHEANEPNLDKIEIINLPSLLNDAKMEVTQYQQAHFFVAFDTEPPLNARISYLDVDGEAAANKRPIPDKDIDFTKAEILSFYIKKGDGFENVPFNNLGKYKVAK